MFYFKLKKIMITNNRYLSVTMKFIGLSIVSTMMLDAEVKQRGSNPAMDTTLWHICQFTIHNFLPLELFNASDACRQVSHGNQNDQFHCIGHTFIFLFVSNTDTI